MTQLATLAPSLLAILYVAEQSGGEFSWPSRFFARAMRVDRTAAALRCGVDSHNATLNEKSKGTQASTS